MNLKVWEGYNGTPKCPQKFVWASSKKRKTGNFKFANLEEISIKFNTE